jgi:hypothetical protein
MKIDASRQDQTYSAFDKFLTVDAFMLFMCMFVHCVHWVRPLRS